MSAQGIRDRVHHLGFVASFIDDRQRQGETHRGGAVHVPGSKGAMQLAVHALCG